MPGAESVVIWKRDGGTEEIIAGHVEGVGRSVHDDGLQFRLRARLYVRDAADRNAKRNHFRGSQCRHGQIRLGRRGADRRFDPKVKKADKSGGRRWRTGLNAQGANPEDPLPTYCQY